MKERVYKLLDGFELIVSEEALFVRVAEGRMPIRGSRIGRHAKWWRMEGKLKRYV